MRKVLALIVLLVCFGLASVLVLFGLLHTQFATPMVNYIAPKLFKTPIQIDSVEYQSPYHLSLHGVEISTSAEPLYVENIQLWLNPDLIQQQKLAVDSLLLSGFSLQQGLPSLDWPSHIKLHQLAIDHFDYSDNDVIVRELALQVKNPQPTRETGIPWYGEWQASAQQVYWQGEAIDQILIDGDFLPDSQKIYGLSFNWQGANFATQAQRHAQKWQLLNTTVNNLTLNQEQLNALPAQLTTPLLNADIEVERFDLLNANIKLDEFSATQLDVTLENWHSNLALWQQNSQLSLNAESIVWKQQQWLEPVITAEMSDEVLYIDDLSTRIQGGFVQLAGQFDRKQANFDHLNLSGVAWLAQRGDRSLLNTLPEWERISIEQLLVRNGQYIDLKSVPKRQVSGLNITGKSLLIKDKTNLGVLAGELRATANSMSYGPLIAAQSLVEMHATQGTSYLDKLIIPINEGLVRAQGEWEFAKVSQPWHLKFAADGYPLDLDTSTRLPELEFLGPSDVQFELRALAGDEAMLAHSLGGFARISLPDATLPADIAELMTGQNQAVQLTFSEITLQADRGRVTLDASPISSESLSGKLSGSLDLTEPEKSTLGIELQGPCGSWQKLFIQSELRQLFRECATR
ncbi:AsmA family protein [Vibrio sp. SCSIO 43136]|uniref:AsmA family protein n=1 Tax=Vibrio sp. SCSIO 43136 TaxID=2819101 RepID=UPI00207603CA|nr:AsmA family protein [Vibrio sp. SCSIO 43136]USD65193.1 AsmA family protein [Vibrio sp. SCSIO 43136]